MSPAGPIRVEPDLDHADSLGLLHRQTAVLELIASGAALPETLTAVTVALEELIPGSRCSVLLLDAVAATLRHGAAPSLPPSYSAAIDGLVIGPDAGSCGAAAHHGTEVVAEDIRLDPRWDRFRALALPHGMRSCWSSPIRGRPPRRDDGVPAGNAMLGTFAVYHDAPHMPTVRERRLVERFTHLASVAIEHAGLYGALAESEERFRRAFEDNAVGMALTDLDGRFTRVNRSLREMLDRTERELLASDLATVLRPDAGTVAALNQLAGRGWPPRPSVQFAATHPRSDGEPLQTAVTASAVRGADGIPVYLSISVLDVTARRAAQRDRSARREAELAQGVAEAASRAKSEFLSALSHELRTPLQAITGFTELLGTLDLSPQRREAALGHIAGASTHILSLVDDVLDIARIEAGALPMHVADLDLGALIGDVVDLLAPVATEYGIELRRGPVHGAVRADGRRLRQVLINLVTNGVRYNHDGGWVEVTADADGPEIAIRVTDSGPGIPPELLGRLFVPFDRLGADDALAPGAGLGMALARGLTELMGGRLSVLCTDSRGTTVEVRVPAVLPVSRMATLPP